MATTPAPKRLWAMQLRQPLPRATVFDRIGFLIGTAAAIWLAVIIIIQGVRSPWALLWIVPIWAMTAYLVLPRLHRMLSDLYVPDYFFGRTRTADGLLGDPVNVAVDGSAAQLDAVMVKAGWHRADEITLASTWGIIVSTITRRSYPTAPVSPLMLFGRRHDVAYQQEVEGNPKQRHHVRFWHCPPGWLLPGGAEVDWLGAATYDTDVGLSLFTLQVTHRIDPNTDIERDHLIDTMREADPAVTVRVLEDFTTGYHSRNGGGDRFVTDGNLPIVELGAVHAAHPEASAVPRTRRLTSAQVMARAPLSVMIAVALIAVVAVMQMLDVFADPQTWLLVAGAAPGERILMAVVLVIYAAFAVGQLVLAWLLLRRRGRRSRVVLMVLVTITIVFMAIDYLNGTVALGLDWTLVSASVLCLTLLSLSSDSAGAWVRRGK